MTQTAMQSLDCHFWRSRITTLTKLHLYNAYVLPIMLYGSESWTSVQVIYHKHYSIKLYDTLQLLQQFLHM